MEVAIHLALLARTDKAREIREYFIRVREEHGMVDRQNLVDQIASLEEQLVKLKEEKKQPEWLTLEEYMVFNDAYHCKLDIREVDSELLLQCEAIGIETRSRQVWYNSTVNEYKYHVIAMFFSMQKQSEEI